MSLSLLALFAANAGLNDWAVLGACFALAMAAVLFIFFI